LQAWKKTEHLRRGVTEASLCVEIVVTRRPGRQAKLLQPNRNETEVRGPSCACLPPERRPPNLVGMRAQGKGVSRADVVSLCRVGNWQMAWICYLSPALHCGDLGAGRPGAAPDATQEQRRHGRLIVQREAQAEPFRRSVVAVDAFPEGEQVVELRGRANRGGVEEGSGWALLRVARSGGRG
jgi:hypothetical protein